MARVEYHILQFFIAYKFSSNVSINRFIVMLSKYVYTVPIDKILSVKNARAWVSMVSYLKKINEN